MKDSEIIDERNIPFPNFQMILPDETIFRVSKHQVTLGLADHYYYEY
jgi:hypothetical protein